MVDLSIAGWMSERDLLWLESIARNSKRVLEIGVFRGRATEALTAAGHVTSVDPWQPYVVNPSEVATPDLEQMDGDALFKEVSDRFNGRNVTLVRGTIDSIPESEKFDFIFLDGDHECSAVRHDIIEALLRLNDGGILAGHDCSMPSVKKSLVEFFGSLVSYPADDIWRIL